MARYAIYACEGIFQGLHGMNEVAVVEGDYDFACEEAAEMSFNVMDSYGEIDEQFQEEAYECGYEENSDEWEEYINDVRCNNVLYYVMRIMDSCSLTDEECENLLNEDYQEFFERYCVDEIG